MLPSFHTEEVVTDSSNVLLRLTSCAHDVVRLRVHLDMMREDENAIIITLRDTNIQTTLLSTRLNLGGNLDKR